MRNLNMNKTGGIKRILKPVIEKKRRDRINQSLSELRTLLLKYTAETRLQNPKLEKAEILDLAVQYIKRGADSRKESRDPESPTPVEERVPQAQISPYSRPLLLDSSPIYTAGFRQCVSNLTCFMGNVNPPERETVLHTLKGYLDGHFTTVARAGHGKEAVHLVDAVSTRVCTLMACHSCSEDPSPYSEKSLQFLCQSSLPNHHLPCQTGGHLSYPSSPDYLSPPASPFFSCSPSFNTPPYPPAPCHFPFPPSTLSPPSSDLSSFSLSTPSPSLSPPLSLTTTILPPFPSELTSLCSPVLTPRRELFPTPTQTTWRPWN